MHLVLPLLFLFPLVAEGHSDNSTPSGTTDTSTTAKVVDFQFDGVWKPKGAMLRGVLLPPPALDAITLTIKDGNYEVAVSGEEQSDIGEYVLDETVMPRRMVIKSRSGPNQGKIFLAIYEIKGKDAMRVCYDLSGNAFPTEFKAPKNSDRYLAGYRRQNKSSETKPNPMKSKTSSGLSNP